MYNNGSEFKLHFKALCNSCQIKRKLTTVNIPQANPVPESIQGVLVNMIRTAGLDLSKTVSSEPVCTFLVDTAWVICSTHHIVLSSTPQVQKYSVRICRLTLPKLLTGQQLGNIDNY